MTKLEQLIKELCLNGVEYKSLGDTCSLVTGATPSKTNPAYWENGTIPWMSSGEVNNKIVYDTETKITQLGYDKTSTSLVPVHSVVIALAGQGKTRGKVAITEIELCTNQSLCSIICGKELNYKFLYYYLDSKYEELREISNGDGTRGGLSLRILKPYVIPVPPLEVQAEIVNLLDEYTESVSSLQQELEKELNARKKQYEYYRDLLLDFGVHGGGASECEWRTLGKIADLLSGFPFDSRQFSGAGIRLMRGMNIKRGFLDFSESNNRYWASDEGLEKYRLHNDDIVIAMDGSLVGKSFGLVSEEQLPLLLVQRVTRIRAKENADNRYIYYCITSAFPSYVDSQKTEGAVPHISLKDISNFKIPFPPIEEQRRIASILDRFDKLCNDISEGLPAEIEARRKQYEYYRDKLLSFEERKNA